MGYHSDNARERIIDAAEQVVLEAGAGHLTFDAVASRAGISRGGLLYHFPDKKSLLRGMLDRRQKRIAETRTKRRAEIPAGPEREAVAFVLSLLDEDSKASGDIMAALIAMAAHDPEILGPVAQESYRQVIADLTRDGLNFERAAVITLATYGLRFFEVLSVSYFNAKERHRIIKELLALAKEPAPNPQGADEVMEHGQK
ncbi:MAG: HTH-type transcriptional regulator SrpR [Syntrophorhabdus sp. PtaU1.Bin002]|nr:MAG: HTH-type transcriptional regulator SrpR [Syntrophorhabdus sp. PtaU1.Bin002]